MGYVYIVSNVAMPGLVKIGSTDRAVDERLLELSSPTGVPAAFSLEFVGACHDHALVEGKVHAALSRARVTSAREFFRVPVEYAKHVLIEELQNQMVEAMASWSDDDVAGFLDRALMRWTDVQVARFLDRIRNRRPGVSRPDVGAILSWTDDQLIHLVDQIFSTRPSVYRQFK